MKDNTILTEEEKRKFKETFGKYIHNVKYRQMFTKVFIDTTNEGNLPGEVELDYQLTDDAILEHFEQLLVKKMEEREGEITDQLNGIDSVEYGFWNRRDDIYPSVRIHSDKYKHYFLSKSGLGDAVKEMFKWIKSKHKQ